MMMDRKKGNSSWKFHEEFHIFENNLVEFFTEIGRVKWHSEKLCQVAAYIFIHKNLTQKQLKELTGYALSTISANLNTLLVGELKKRRISRTNQYEYYFGDTLQEFLNEGREARNNEILDLYSFLEKKLLELEELVKNGELGADFVHKRTEELFRFAKTFKNLIDDSKSIMSK